jgi:hypothetical protein
LRLLVLLEQPHVSLRLTLAGPCLSSNSLSLPLSYS